VPRVRIFLVIGRQFQTFLTTSDYLTNGALWLPLGAWLLYALGEWSWLKDDKPVKKSDPSKWAALLSLLIIILISIGFFLVVTWPPDVIYFSMWLFFIFFAWSTIWRRFVPRIEIEAPFGSVIKYAIQYAPPLLLGMFVYGTVHANQDLTAKYDPYAFQFKDQPTERLLFFLRNFDRGVLVRDPVSDKIAFYKWDEVVSVTRSASTISGPLFCWLMPSWCGRPSPVTP
jgi:hypothetical protein